MISVGRQADQKLDRSRAILITGAAGFLGYFLSRRLLEDGFRVIGVDSLNDYYDPRLKAERLRLLGEFRGFEFLRADLADPEAARAVFARERFETVAHLAAQAGVRYSLDNPRAYVDSNLAGFVNVLEGCRAADARHLVYASSSSVYGGNAKLPFSTKDAADHPVSLYAATKRANELMAHAYAHLYGLPATGLRFFTVYGPLGRPDMAYYKFAAAIREGREIAVFNNGDMRRDFTYVDDVIDGVTRLLARSPQPDPAFDRAAPDLSRSWAPHRVYNIGAKRPEPLLDMIATLERLMGRTAEKRFLPMQPGDVRETWADVSDLEDEIGPLPSTPLAEGLSRFVTWFKKYHSE